MGVTEEEIIQRLTDAVTALAAAEREARESASGNIALEDRIMRSYGIMKYARSVDTKELYRLYSDVRLGICLGLIDKSLEEVDRLRMECMRGNLCLLYGNELSAEKRDEKRAEKLRGF